MLLCSIFLLIFGAHLDLFFTCHLISYSLNNKLICCDQLGYHLLKTDQGFISMGDRSSIKVWLVSIGGRRNLPICIMCCLAIIFIVALHLISETIVAKLWQHWYRNKIRVIPKTGLLLLRFLFNFGLATAPPLAIGRDLRLCHSRLVVELTRLEGTLGLIY